MRSNVLRSGGDRKLWGLSGAGWMPAYLPICLSVYFRADCDLSPSTTLSSCFAPLASPHSTQHTAQSAYMFMFMYMYTQHHIITSSHHTPPTLTPPLPHSLSDVRCPMSDVRCPMSDVRCTVTVISWDSGIIFVFF
jgi:hypothetical protein